MVIETLPVRATPVKVRYNPVNEEPGRYRRWLLTILSRSGGATSSAHNLQTRSTVTGNLTEGDSFESDMAISSPRFSELTIRVQASESLARVEFQSLIPAIMKAIRQMDARRAPNSAFYTTSIPSCNSHKHSIDEQCGANRNHHSGNQCTVFHLEPASIMAAAYMRSTPTTMSTSSGIPPRYGASCHDSIYHRS